MIIGLTGDKTERDQLTNYICTKDNFEVLDVDELFNKEIQKEEYKNNLTPLKYNKLLCNIDQKIVDYIKENGSNNLIISYSHLNFSYIYNYTDINISTSNSSYSKNVAAPLYMLPSNTDNQTNINMKKNWQKELDAIISKSQNNNELISVIVPIYNTSMYLVKCVRSILNQTYKNLEVILINDGSTDNSLDICNELAKSDKRIRVISQENCGLSETRNNGVTIAKGDYVCFVDSDDFIEKDMIEHLYNLLKENNVDISAIRANIHLRDGKIIGFNAPKREIKVFKGLKNVLDGYANGEVSIAAWDKLYKKEAIKDIKFDPKTFKEDVDYIFKLCLADRSFVCDTKEYYHYIKRESNSITSTFNSKMFQLVDWSFWAYNKTLELGHDYIDDAEMLLYNGLTHVLKLYARDLKRGIVNNQMYTEEIQDVVNKITYLLLHTNNGAKFKDLKNVLEIIDDFEKKGIIRKDKKPYLDVKCIGVLWNSLNPSLMNEAINEISEKANIEKVYIADLGDKYYDFINEIYSKETEFEGIPYLKACGLIDKFDSNEFAILYLIIRVTGLSNNKLKGFLFKEIDELKKQIRYNYKTKINNYAFDNLFHLTVNEEEYNFTDEIVKRYIEDKTYERQKKK